MSSKYRGFRGNEPPLPKPYAFVPISRAPMDLKPPAGHADFSDEALTGTIRGRIIARSPVHVASGITDLTGVVPSLVKAHFRCKGKPTIPGSSLKGAIRSIVEAISYPPSCIRVSWAQSEKLPTNVNRCTEVKRSATRTKLCIACRMFGAMGYLGQVQFSDATADTDKTEIIQIPPLHAPHPRESLYYESRKIIGRKFYMHGANGKTAAGNVPTEVCRPGTTFGMRVDFDNLQPSELILLLVALGQGNPRLWPKLGGGKPACCGSVEIEDISVTTVSTAASAISLDLDFKEVAIASLSALETHVDMESLKKIADALAYPGPGPCPDRNY